MYVPRNLWWGVPHTERWAKEDGEGHTERDVVVIVCLESDLLLLLKVCCSTYIIFWKTNCLTDKFNNAT